MNLFQDIKVAIDLTKATRKARKAGATIEVRQCWSVPFKEFDLWPFTPEACILRGELGKAVSAVFDGFDKETQHMLTFSPKAGEWPARVRFWQKALRPSLPEHLYREAMGILLDWAIRRTRARAEVMA